MSGEGVERHVLSRRMVLRSRGDERKVRRLVDELRMVPLGEERPAAALLQRSWQMSPGVFFQALTDERADATAVVLVGDDQEQVARFAELVERFVQPLTDEELLAAITSARTATERARAVLTSGLGAPFAYDARYFERITAAMFDKDREVRAAGLAASSYAFWPQYLEPLAAMAEFDEDPVLREDAGVALEARYDAPDVRTEGEEDG
ncbi:hypothetical protein [Streptomyces sp. DSM 15324]|uniref:hypothetical protein n=1 Tax=Streptomyces sp. DSM 15324 TaxID=1739111 RepID=UPI0007460AF8|nr:hypothetical protein [Streptomyces sp. DSM 15324]KUO08462.1 hypothetical protein AQJ58_31200 [Streptomyces sp. DSM 15324]